MKKHIFMITLFLGLLFLFNIDAKANVDICIKWEISSSTFVEKKSEKLGKECGKNVKYEYDISRYCWEKESGGYNIYNAVPICTQYDTVDETYDCSKYTYSRCVGECAWDSLTKACYNGGNSPSRLADNNTNETHQNCLYLNKSECKKSKDYSCAWDEVASRCYNPAAAGFEPDGNGNLVLINPTVPVDNPVGENETPGEDSGDGDDQEQLPDTCEGILGDFKDDLESALDAIRIIGPILVGIFTVIEFLKAVADKNQDSLTKAGQRLVKRAILIVLLFFLPILINLLLMFIDSQYTTCIK